MQRWMGEQVSWTTALAAAHGLYQSPRHWFLQMNTWLALVSPWEMGRMGTLEIRAKAKGRKSAGLGSQAPWWKAFAESSLNNFFVVCQILCLPSQAGKGEHGSSWADQICDGNFSGYPLQNNCLAFTPLSSSPRKQQLKWETPRSFRDLIFASSTLSGSFTHHCSKTFTNCDLDLPATYSIAQEQKALLVLWVIPSNTRCCLISPEKPTPTIL